LIRESPNCLCHDKIFLMINEYKHNDITWIDLDNPTAEEARDVAERFDIQPLVADELLSPTLRPKVDYYKDYIYLILHFPVMHKTDEQMQKSEAIQEVDFIIGKKFIITTRYTAVDALLEFSRVFEVQSILNKDDPSDHAGYLFFYMIRHLYKSMMNRLANINDLLVDIENQIFNGKEKQMVLEISRLNRLLLNYQQSTALHREILESFEVAGKKFFGEDFDYHLHGILGEYQKVRTEMQAAKEYLDELRNTNDSLLSTTQNEIMKILTITNFVILPMALIAGLFGMNTVTTPLVGHHYDFLIIVGIMFVLAASTYLFFRWKKWL
jgi:magnesium transporter